MQRVRRSTAAASLPAAPTGGTPGYFANPNPGGGVPATVPGYEWFNSVQEELAAPIEGSGMTLDGTKYNQLFLAIKRIFIKTQTLTDTGTANTYTAANTPALTLADIKPGLTQQVLIANTNSGASTYSPDGLRQDPIYGLGLQALQGGELVAGATAILMSATIAGVNGGYPIYVLLESMGGRQQIPSDTPRQHAMAIGQARNRNPIINGRMDIAQRGSSFALQTLWKYGSLDRWAAIQATTAQGVLAQAAASLPNFSYCAKLGRNNGATSTGFIGMLQALETLDSIPLQGKTCTLSFYGKAGANYSGGATFGAMVWAGQGTDQAAGNYAAWTNGASAGVTNPTLTTAWQRFSYQVAIPALTTQLALIFSYTPQGAAGADDNIYITGVQLEPWPIASDFDHRPISLELEMCQRYFETGGLSLSVTTGTSNGIGGTFKATKRAVPAMVRTGQFISANETGSVFTGITVNQYGITNTTTAAGGIWTADAEL